MTESIIAKNLSGIPPLPAVHQPMQRNAKWNRSKIVTRLRFTPMEFVR